MYLEMVIMSPQPYSPAETFPRLNTDGCCSPSTKPDQAVPESPLESLHQASPFSKHNTCGCIHPPNGMFAFFTAALRIDSLIHSTPDLYL